MLFFNLMQSRLVSKGKICELSGHYRRSPNLQNSFRMMTSSNGNIFRVTGPLCGEFTGPGEFPTQRPVTRSFDVYFDLRLNKRLSKQSWGWWFETLSPSLWRHRNGLTIHYHAIYYWNKSLGLRMCVYGALILKLTYHGYAMRKNLPLWIKTVTCKSKGSLCLLGHNSRMHCFCLKNLNLFPKILHSE